MCQIKKKVVPITILVGVILSSCSEPFSDFNKLSINYILIDVQRINNQSKQSFVIIDYVQLIRDYKDKNIWKTLKEFAENENLIIFILSQLKIDFDPQNVLKDLHMLNVELQYVSHT
ncbi:DnaB-like helicase C-terminal domain-containing protein [Plebeiibacterium marinum]|uniref:SF4 helicase domain-containing protein n=1 Tax=Plebeiibacterium marinum TaxID=2992111 RepID=A0AAE3MDS5_9BACT|nr:DnaB-like helicase C-terminal domain-containing protein [Plebeiobacterium marinum]MCW3805740.1 hypothetical protein [Plebeiobacterium marinum]